MIITGEAVLTVVGTEVAVHIKLSVMGTILAIPSHSITLPVEIPKPKSFANKSFVPSVVGKCNSINPKVPYKVDSILPAGISIFGLKEIS